MLQGAETQRSRHSTWRLLNPLTPRDVTLHFSFEKGRSSFACCEVRRSGVLVPLVFNLVPGSGLVVISTPCRLYSDETTRCTHWVGHGLYLHSLRNRNNWCFCRGLNQNLSLAHTVPQSLHRLRDYPVTQLPNLFCNECSLILFLYGVCYWRLG